MPQLPQLPPVADQPISAVLLACDATADVEGVVASWVGFLESLREAQGREYELLLADGSAGGEVALRSTSLPERYPRLRVLRAGRPGEGPALAEGVREARYPLFFYTLCDPVYQPADLDKMLRRRTLAADNDLEIDHVHVMSGLR